MTTWTCHFKKEKRERGRTTGKDHFRYHMNIEAKFLQKKPQKIPQPRQISILRLVKVEWFSGRKWVWILIWYLKLSLVATAEKEDFTSYCTLALSQLAGRLVLLLCSDHCVRYSSKLVHIKNVNKTRCIPQSRNGVKHLEYRKIANGSTSCLVKIFPDQFKEWQVNVFSMVHFWEKWISSKVSLATVIITLMI